MKRNDANPPLDWERDKGLFGGLIAAKLEKRLQYWKERQEEEFLRLYRQYNSF